MVVVLLLLLLPLLGDSVAASYPGYGVRAGPSS